MQNHQPIPLPQTPKKIDCKCFTPTIINLLISAVSLLACAWCAADAQIKDAQYKSITEQNENLIKRINDFDRRLAASTQPRR